MNNAETVIICAAFTIWSGQLPNRKNLPTLRLYMMNVWIFHLLLSLIFLTRRGYKFQKNSSSFNLISQKSLNQASEIKFW